MITQAGLFLVVTGCHTFPGYGYEIIDFIRIDPFIPCAGNYCLCNRMFAVCVQGRGYPENVLIRQVPKRSERFQRRFAFRNSSGLVDDQCVYLVHFFYGPGIPDQDP